MAAAQLKNRRSKQEVVSINFNMLPRESPLSESFLFIP